MMKSSSFKAARPVFRRITTTVASISSSTNGNLGRRAISATTTFQSKRLGATTQRLLVAPGSVGVGRWSYATRSSSSSSSSSNNNTSKSSEVTELQKAHWASYLASGRGTHALFNLFDKDVNGKLSRSELQKFLVAVQAVSGPLPPGTMAAMTAASGDDHAMDFAEFQNWLMRLTQEITHSSSSASSGGGGTCLQPLYETSPHTGDRRSAGLQQLPAPPEYTWNMSTMSQALRRMQYAVRGEVVMAAEKLAAEGREVIYTNIGNPQAIGQMPLTYYRQVLALCDLPSEFGIDHPQAHLLFPADVMARARELREIIGPAGTGAYTHSQGLPGIRKQVADFIAQRDGHPAFQGDIFLTNGASHGIELILNGLISCNSDAIMIPIPQYPIYSALITKLGGHKIGYELEEELGWGVTRDELYKRLDEAKLRGLNVKGLALINPGNPTGQVMSRTDLATVCRFCADNGIVLLADEVYQRNVYVQDKQFISAKKVALETPGCGDLQLVSFHSTSKGLIGECGRRGGYMELHHIDPYVQSQIYKLASSGLCSGTAGQIMTSLMVQGPIPGGESEALFKQEETEIFESLKRRAKALVDGLNSIDGIVCQRAEGAMYAFPRIYLPQKALEEANANNQTPDTLYALSLLEETGICVVPASGFGQKEGRVGFRTTFLPKDEQLFRAISEFKRHHKLFCDKYSK